MLRSAGILLSAGHSPSSKGASYNGFNEYDEATRWVYLLHGLLINTHAFPCATVPAGNLLSKVAHINADPFVKLAIEIHFNSDESKRQHGSETLYMPGSEKGKWAAEIVQTELAGLFAPSRGVKEGWHKQDKPGHVDYRGDEDGDEAVIYFLRATKPVALVLEPEFIYNRETIETKRDAACAVLAAAFVHIAGVLSK